MAENSKNGTEVPVAMIIGPPRSGTSLLGQVLDRHPSISTWVEPYYIWDHRFREAPHDQRTAEDASPEVCAWIRKAFDGYRRALGAEWVADKSPRNCLKIPFVRKVLPAARFIFIFRDGRDTVLSIRRQWERKRAIFEADGGESAWQNRLFVVRRWLQRRPTWRLRLRSVLFELGDPGDWIRKRTLNRIRWEGRFGWGPRFPRWQNWIDRVTALEFSAHQWVHCVRGILDHIDSIPDQRRLMIRYEDCTRDPEPWIRNIFELLQLPFPAKFMQTIPPIRADNTGKWQHAFSTDDLQTIGPLVGPLLIELGYEKDESWYQRVPA